MGGSPQKGPMMRKVFVSLRWRHNDHDGVSNHQPHGCLFRRRSKKTPKLSVTGLCAGNSPVAVNSPHKGPVTRKMFPFDDVIMMPCHHHVRAREPVFHHTWRVSLFYVMASYLNPYLLPTGPLGTNFGEILIKLLSGKGWFQCHRNAYI